ncbi:DUF6671 family protein [Flavobacterium sp.]|uniref:DUF6671 family protein n=1 Tax=Flavobacterium sp. TaxID=239 RepID=UPI002624E2CE|nr:DUF6671 family protein [Flavobacterium sp.]MDG2431619.1 hypothetical protein [Flavobacterium sp.]
MFANRKLFIATKHQKENVIKPLLEQNMGVECFTLPDFETDNLGTFSGEIRRENDPLTTVRTKCDQGRAYSNCDLVIANEGSFGGHPSLFFANADDELIMLKDYKNNIEIVAREISVHTNLNAAIIENEEQLLAFAKQVNFPSHAIILKDSPSRKRWVFKGIQNEVLLLQKFRQLKATYGCAYAETDMRARYNPTRMQVISKTVEKLIEKINKRCPHCVTPGFDVVKANSGLPCANCAFPTRSILSCTYKCQICNHVEEEFYPKQKTEEDPTYCDNCNP